MTYSSLLSSQADHKKGLRPHLITEIMLQLVYPRLDIHVTKGLNHLLKSPFCIHPKTGRVCVCFDPLKAEQFDPMAVPHLRSVTIKCRALQMCVKLEMTQEDLPNEWVNEIYPLHYLLTGLEHHLTNASDFSRQHSSSMTRCPILMSTNGSEAGLKCSSPTLGG